jgi:phosphoglycolate phosphatase
MTDVPVDDPETLRRILANTEALLLDFDGPICSVFAGFPARIVANQLRDILAEGGHKVLPDEVEDSTDPFDVLKHAATLGDLEASYVEAAFRAHEIEAIKTAKPTPAAHSTIITWKQTGRKLAIVSNNSTAAISTYLHQHNLHSYVDLVSARVDSNIKHLKPDRHLVCQAVELLQATARRCTFVGDSATDMIAGSAAEVRLIGYANKPHKLKALSMSDTQAIVTSMSTLLSAIDDQP